MKLFADIALGLVRRLAAKLYSSWLCDGDAARRHASR